MIFYLGTIIVSLIGDILVVLKVRNDVSNKGYEFKKNKNNRFELITIVLQLFLFSALPIGNLIFSGILLFGIDRFSSIYIKESIKYGMLIKKEDKIIEEFELDNNMEKDRKIDSSLIKDKIYKEMTRETKLEILREEYRKLTEHQVADNNNQKKNKDR